MTRTYTGPELGTIRQPLPPSRKHRLSLSEHCMHCGEFQPAKHEDCPALIREAAAETEPS